MSRKILYVDDELDSRAIIAGHLRYRGYEVLTVEKAPNALRVAAEAPIDAIILDVNLIGMDGPELMQLLHESHHEVPIILYTGMNRDAKKVQEMLAAGATSFVSKNDPLDSLTRAISEAVQNKPHMAGDAD